MPISESGKKELVSEVSVSAAVSESGVKESGPLSESCLKEPVSLLFIRAAGASACSPCAAGTYNGFTGARHLSLMQKYRLYHVTLTINSSARCAYIYSIFYYYIFHSTSYTYIIMLLVMVWAHFALARISLLVVI